MKYIKSSIIWICCAVVICSCSRTTVKIPADDVSRIVLSDMFQEVSKDADRNDFNSILQLLEKAAELSIERNGCDCAPEAFITIYCGDGNTYSLNVTSGGAAYLSDDDGTVASGWRRISADDLLTINSVLEKYF